MTMIVNNLYINMKHTNDKINNTSIFLKCQITYYLKTFFSGQKYYIWHQCLKRNIIISNKLERLRK